MRKVAYGALAAIMLFACGKDKTTSPEPEGITVTVLPLRGTVDLDSTLNFHATVNGATDQRVTWLVNNTVGGDAVYGTIDSIGKYRAPAVEPFGTDSVRVTARSIADSTKSGNAYAILVDPGVIYVQFFGSDTSGVGSSRRPYRSITKALGRARSGQRIVVGAGEFNIAAGERFPLRITSGITLTGAGGDSTYITGPGGINPLTDALIEIDGDAVVVEKLHLRSSNSLGVGAWIKPGVQTRFTQNWVSNNYIGIYTSGAGIPRPLIEGNRISDDSLGIVTADASRPIVRNCTIVKCPKYGIDIRGTSAPDLGVNDSTGAGQNTIDSCGNAGYWLIYNGTTNTIWAVGNTWPNPTPDFNDPFIWDDEESPGTGRVILTEQR